MYKKMNKIAGVIAILSTISVIYFFTSGTKMLLSGSVNINYLLIAIALAIPNIIESGRNLLKTKKITKKSMYIMSFILYVTAINYGFGSDTTVKTNLLSTHTGIIFYTAVGTIVGGNLVRIRKSCRNSSFLRRASKVLSIGILSLILNDYLVITKIIAEGRTGDTLVNIVELGLTAVSYTHLRAHET